jgi:polyhydroxybutyrate depolymerase
VRVVGAIGVALALIAWGCGSSGSSSTTPGSTSAQSATSARATTPALASCTRRTRLRGAPLRTVLRVPPSARGHRAPLVLALHFAGGTGRLMEQATQLTPQARRSGFVVAYPTASEGNFWSIDNDLGRLTKTIAAIERATCIDPARVYVVGISNGGFMSTVLACRMADKIAAAALFAPGVNGIGDCRPSRPISVLEIHGTADPIVPYRGSGDPATAIPNFVAAWAQRDGCASTAVARRPGPTLTLLRWPGCRDRTRVEHLRLTGGQHIELLPELRAAGVDPARFAWRFLSAHRLPG